MNVKIHIVDELFVGGAYKTDVWISKAAAEHLDEFAGERDGIRFVKKLEEYAKAGFANFEGASILHEWSGVYRVAHRASLFRLVGFYERRPESFIAIDAFVKHGQQLSKSDRLRIDRVADVCRLHSWKRRET